MKTIKVEINCIVYDFLKDHDFNFEEELTNFLIDRFDDLVESDYEQRYFD